MLKYLTPIVSLLLFALPLLAGTLKEIYITPGYVAIRPNAAQLFKVFGIDDAGNDVPVNGSLTWSCDPAIGTISPSGFFIAKFTTALYREGIRVTTSGGLTATASVEVVQPQTQSGYTFEKSWGGWAAGQMNRPLGMCTDKSGNVYVADTYNNRIQKFDNNGRFLMQFGTYGTADGQFDYPWGVTVDSQGNIYVSDTLNQRIQKFDSNGNFILKWGSFGTAPGQLGGPQNITISPDGYLYVAEQYNHRVQKFDLSGNSITMWGSYGNGNGLFDMPYGVAVDGNNRVYVTDIYNMDIQAFTSTGGFISRLDYSGAGGITCNSKNHLIAPDWDSVDEYDSNLNLVNSWGTYGVGSGQFDNARAAAVDGADNVFIVDAVWGGRVSKFDSRGNFLTQWGAHGKGYLGDIMGFAADKSGNVYVTNTDQTVKFDALGRYASTFIGGNDVAVDRAGCIYVLHQPRYPEVMNNSRIWKLDASGNVISIMGEYGYNTPGQFEHLDAIAVDPRGYFYITDNNRDKVLKYTLSGTFVKEWGSTGTGNGQFSTPKDIAVDSKGFVYVLDSTNRCIQKFDSNGNFILKWGTYGSGDGQFQEPVSVAIDAQNYVYATDYYNGCVAKFDSNGNLISALGTYGPDATKVTECADLYVAVDDFGNVYVADDKRHQILKYATNSYAIGQMKSLPDGAFVSLTGQYVTAGTANLGDCSYIQMPDVPNGIKVTGKPLTLNWKADVRGILATVNGEREIQASYVTSVGTTVVTPIFLNNKAVGGGNFQFDEATSQGQRGVENGEGANNIGLFIKTSGVVTAVGADYIYIDDGTRTRDSSGFVGIKVVCGKVTKPAVGAYVSVKGISCINAVDGHYFRCIRVRNVYDIKTLKQAPVN